VVNLNIDLHIVRRVLAEIPVLVKTLLTISFQISIAPTLESKLLAVQALCPWVTSWNVETVPELVITHLNILGFCANISTL